MKLENYTKKKDIKYNSYKNNIKYKEIKNTNPTIFLINFCFLNIFSKSFIVQLLEQSNKQIAQCLIHFLNFKTYIKGSEKKYPILQMLIKHGFETIYDILLENTDSFYLYAFLSHLCSVGIIHNPNNFMIEYNKSTIHEKLRNRKIIEVLQRHNLYTRLKKYQI